MLFCPRVLVTGWKTSHENEMQRLFGHHLFTSASLLSHSSSREVEVLDTSRRFLGASISEKNDKADNVGDTDQFSGIVNKQTSAVYQSDTDTAGGQLLITTVNRYIIYISCITCSFVTLYSSLVSQCTLYITYICIDDVFKKYHFDEFTFCLHSKQERIVFPQPITNYTLQQ